MTRKLFLIVAAMMIFGLGIAAVAYTTTSASTATAACCCCKGDSCPMKSKDASAKDASTKDAASCPMKSMDASAKDGASCCESCEHCMAGHAKHAKGDHAKGNHAKGDHAKGDHAMSGHSMEGHKAGDGASCPMKKKNADASPAVAMESSAKVEATEGKSCSCPCCNAAEKAVVPEA